MKNLEYNGQVVQSLCLAYFDITANLENLPGLIVKAVREDCWREFVIDATKDEIKFDNFEEFVAAKPPVGLDASMRTLRNVCRDDAKAISAIDAVCQRKDGNPTGTNQHGTVDNINSSSEENMSEDFLESLKDLDNPPEKEKRPTGTSQAGTIRRLRKDNPELHEKVMEGEMSANAAAIEAGWRKKPKPLDQMKKAWSKASNEEKTDFLEWLKEEGSI